jgi:hypothetical protein
MGQGDPGRQHQAAGMKSRPKIGKTFHNVSFGKIAGVRACDEVVEYNPRTSFAAAHEFAPQRRAGHGPAEA